MPAAAEGCLARTSALLLLLACARPWGLFGLSPKHRAVSRDRDGDRRPRRPRLGESSSPAAVARARQVTAVGGKGPSCSPGGHRVSSPATEVLKCLSTILDRLKATFREEEQSVSLAPAAPATIPPSAPVAGDGPSAPSRVSTCPSAPSPCTETFCFPTCVFPQPSAPVGTCAGVVVELPQPRARPVPAPSALAVSAAVLRRGSAGRRRLAAPRGLLPAPSPLPVHLAPSLRSPRGVARAPAGHRAVV